MIFEVSGMRDCCAANTAPLSIIVVWSAITAAYPCVRLFGTQTFYFDWFTHTAFVNFFGRAIRAASLPLMFSFENMTGQFFPSLYGTLFYPTLGIVAGFVPGDFAIRLAAFVLISYQAAMLTILFLSFGARRSAFLLAAIAVWSSYAFVNLYTRSAITEFFATTMYSIALLHVIAFLIESKQRDANASRQGFLAIFWLTFVVGTHPITAVLGITFLLLTWPYLIWVAGASVRELRRCFDGRIIVGLLLSLICVGPWIYIAARYGREMNVTFSSLAYYPSIDTLFARLSLLPTDPRIYDMEAKDVSTPFLFAQINVGLLLVTAIFYVLYCYELIFCRDISDPKRALIIAVGPLFLFLILLLISVPSGVGDFLPFFLNAAQFGYRFITYANLALLLALIAIPFRGSEGRGVRGAIIWVAATISASCIYVLVSNPILGDKSMGRVHLESFAGASYRAHTDVELEQNLARWKADMNGGTILPIAFMDQLFSTQRLFNSAPALISLVVNLSNGMHPIHCSDGDTVLTNVVAFPWNGLADNNGRIGLERLFQSEGRLGFYCSSSAEKVSYADLTPAGFRVAMDASRGIFWCWIIWMIVEQLASLRKGGLKAVKGLALLKRPRF
jgi:hypothetical protein